MYKKNLKWLWPLCLILVLVTGCGNSAGSKSSSEGTAGEDESKNRLQVVTTFYPMYEFTQKVAGNLADVSLMVPAGTDTHHYEPSAKELALISRADMFVYNSPEMEIWVPDVLNTLGENQHLLAVEAAKDIEMKRFEENQEQEEDHAEDDHEDHGHSHDGKDPHVWLDPILAQREVQVIKEAFIEKDPQNAETYEKNAAAYIDELNDLHDEFVNAFGQAKKRVFITQHAAFGYLAARYNLTQLSIAGLSTENEPSPSQLAQITQMIRKYEIPVIYKNSDVTGGTSATIAQETGVKVEELNALESLTPKQMETDGYLSIMQKNLNALKKSIR